MNRHGSFHIFVLLIVLLSAGCGRKPVANEGSPSTAGAEGDSRGTFVRVFNFLPAIEVDVFGDENLVFKRFPIFH